MGMNSIKCENYAGAGKTIFGEGTRSASDFGGTDILKGVSILALLAAGTLVAGCVGKDENPKLEQQQYRFNRFGDTKTVHDEATNKTYELEFNGLNEERDHIHYSVAHFNVYEVGGQGKNMIGEIELIDLTSPLNRKEPMTLPGTGIDLDVDIGTGYVDLKVTER